MKTIYLAQAFSYEVKKGKATKKLLNEQPIQYASADQAISRARRMAETKAGAIAIAQQYDEATGEAGDYEVLWQDGILPQGLGEE
ncbi:hypothetical protein A7Q01_00965 [Eikenella sp. NML96-A-049]|uniref:hypothetical protein n=1 Tax=unclassified Eikenella TaxID=2639367 RepID=UPI0007E21E94|nr:MULTISPECIES: hypothetical protein [unclassified Eikenella]OAM33556.1 hypothetical protein A7P97_08240 [Eikenella sp. NML070372]OAM42488.1 hypothetical protein A7Q01_00965 [Eikenella sp. NML96-A-049]